MKDPGTCDEVSKRVNIRIMVKTMLQVHFVKVNIKVRIYANVMVSIQVKHRKDKAECLDKSNPKQHLCTLPVIQHDTCMYCIHDFLSALKVE